MNIYAENGHKVVCRTLDAGYSDDKQRAADYLVIGKEYTVEKTSVHSWHTDVWLQEFPGIRFNSVFFADADRSPDSPAPEEHANTPEQKHYSEKRYLILSGEGRSDIAHRFCAAFDDIEKCNAAFEELKAGEFSDTWLYIFEGVQLREE